MTTKEIESRLTELEESVKVLQARMNSQVTQPWWIAQAGRFENDPVFDEIVRLGREYRESLRPGKPKKKKKGTKQNGRA